MAVIGFVYINKTVTRDNVEITNINSNYKWFITANAILIFT